MSRFSIKKRESCIAKVYASNILLFAMIGKYIVYSFQVKRGIHKSNNGCSSWFSKNKILFIWTTFGSFTATLLSGWSAGEGSRMANKDCLLVIQPGKPDGTIFRETLNCSKPQGIRCYMPSGYRPNSFTVWHMATRFFGGTSGCTL